MIRTIIPPCGVLRGSHSQGGEARRFAGPAPVKFEWIMNLETAKVLGLDVPPSLLTLADEVIE
jgi:hypothetical protein